VINGKKRRNTGTNAGLQRGAVPPPRFPGSRAARRHKVTDWMRANSERERRRYRRHAIGDAAPRFTAWAITLFLSRDAGCRAGALDPRSSLVQSEGRDHRLFQLFVRFRLMATLPCSWCDTKDNVGLEHHDRAREVIESSRPYVVAVSSTRLRFEIKNVVRPCASRCFIKRRDRDLATAAAHAGLPVSGRDNGDDRANRRAPVR